jgi:hypothetical protein
MSLLVTGAYFQNPDELEAQLISAFEQWADEDLDDEYMRAQFQEVEWPYRAVTIRKNGEVVGPGPRDIYDLGKLYESGQRSFQIRRSATEVVASWHWDAKNSSGEEYAWFVHEGEGPHSVEARRWTDEIATPYFFDSSSTKRALEANITLRMNR